MSTAAERLIPPGDRGVIDLEPAANGLPVLRAILVHQDEVGQVLAGPLGHSGQDPGEVPGPARILREVAEVGEDDVGGGAVYGHSYRRRATLGSQNGPARLAAFGRSQGEWDAPEDLIAPGKRLDGVRYAW